jgi:hypothetical protein
MSRYSGLPVYRADFGDFFAVQTVPSVDLIFNTMATSDHVWKSGDRMDKLAYLYYQNENLWWIICWFNQIPDEAELVPGNVLLIPENPEIIISLFDRENRKIGNL